MQYQFYAVIHLSCFANKPIIFLFLFTDGIPITANAFPLPCLAFLHSVTSHGGGSPRQQDLLTMFWHVGWTRAHTGVCLCMLVRKCMWVYFVLIACVKCEKRRAGLTSDKVGLGERIVTS